jgi:adenine-specific DNA-methyltransferase
MKSQMRNVALHQFMTPEWAARELVEFMLPDVGPSDLIMEPCCGSGMFLKAVPDHVPAFGVEIDPLLAAEAELNSGREIIVGDFRTVEIPRRPTAIIGNPPYRMKLFLEFLDRAHALLPNDGRCGFLVSTHMVQTPDTVTRWTDRWSIDQQIVPRTLFPRAQRPLVFVTFTKNTLGAMKGFLLYGQAGDVSRMTVAARRLLVAGEPRKSCWRSLVEWALQGLGGRGTLQAIYFVIAPHRPPTNKWWREKVRQILQLYFVPIDRGVWGIVA